MPCEFPEWILSLWRDQQTFKNGESLKLSNSIGKNYAQSKVKRLHRSTVIVCDVKPSSDNSPEHLSKLYDWYCQNTNRYHSWNDSYGSVQTERRFLTKIAFLIVSSRHGLPMTLSVKGKCISVLVLSMIHHLGKQDKPWRLCSWAPVNRSDIWAHSCLVRIIQYTFVRKCYRWGKLKNLV